MGRSAFFLIPLGLNIILSIFYVGVQIHQRMQMPKKNHKKYMHAIKEGIWQAVLYNQVHDIFLLVRINHLLKKDFELIRKWKDFLIEMDEW